jgi:hypothetical protein
VTYQQDPRVDTFIGATCVATGDCRDTPNEKFNTRALRKMFRQIIANNRAGGWRKIKNEE